MSVISGLTGNDAYVLARNYANKKIKEVISEKIGEAEIDANGNLIITTSNDNISFSINENGELILMTNNNDVADINETELDSAIDSAINNVLGGDV